MVQALDSAKDHGWGIALAHYTTMPLQKHHLVECSDSQTEELHQKGTLATQHLRNASVTLQWGPSAAASQKAIGTPPVRGQPRSGHSQPRLQAAAAQLATLGPVPQNKRLLDTFGSLRRHNNSGRTATTLHSFP